MKFEERKKVKFRYEWMMVVNSTEKSKDESTDVFFKSR